jgi:hypothetical protein
MKAIKNNLFAACVLGLSLSACSPENVQPRNTSDTGPKIGLMEDHPLQAPNCSGYERIDLISEDGSLNVNYCRTGCVGPQPKWGYVELYNTDSVFVINVGLVNGWFVDVAKTKAALANSFTFNTPSGLPNTTNWTTVTVLPRLNRWQFLVPRRTIQAGPDNCFAFAANINVIGRISFIQGWDPNSPRSLWAYNPNWNVAGPKQSPSPYIYPWCWGFCLPEADTLCAVAYARMPTAAGNAGCATLTPNVVGLSSGSLAYAWSTGATSPSISVCPSTTTDYTVTITESPSRQPVAVRTYQVNAVDVRCSPGNSPHHKVYVCHIPPGNPNNPQEICIDWNGVPAHVARFRAPGSNPNQGHDSGCEIGRCGSNPCL